MQNSLSSRQFKTGNKGIFFSFILFLILVAVLAINEDIKRSSSTQKEINAETSAFHSVDNRFNDIYHRTVSIKAGPRGRVQGRILPFDFDSGNDWISVAQSLNFEHVNTVYETLFDALNLYEIFVEDANLSPEFATIVTSPKNNDWQAGMLEDDFTYVVLPQCLEIQPADIDDASELLFKASTTGDFDYCPEDFPTASVTDAIDRVEITIYASRYSDVLTPVCRGSFSVNDPAIGDCVGEQAFDQIKLDAGMPYVVVHLVADECIPKCSGDTECCYSGGSHTIAAHVNTTKTANYVLLELDSGGTLQFDFQNSVTPENILVFKETTLAKGMLVDANINFVGTLQELRFNGFRTLSVSKPNFGIERKID